MKNLLIYISQNKKFDEENAKYIKIQIENSLHYWDRDDIMLCTNFPYEHMGVKSTVILDDMHSDLSCCVIKVNVIVYLLELGILKDTAWFHDTEAWQVASLDVELEKNIGLTDYGWSKKWNGGSMFVKPESLEMLRMWKRAIHKHRTDDERALMKLTETNVDDINSHIQRMNITYNVGKRRVDENMARADKPVKVFHFHPYRENLLEKFYHRLPQNLKELMYENDPYNRS